MDDNFQNLKELWAKICMDNGKIFGIVLETFCNKCKRYISQRQITIDEYYDRIGEFIFLEDYCNNCKVI